MRAARLFLHIFINLGIILPSLAQEVRGQDAEILRRAKAEGSVDFYTSSSVREMSLLADGFSKKFPFLKVDVTQYHVKINYP